MSLTLLPWGSSLERRLLGFLPTPSLAPPMWEVEVPSTHWAHSQWGGPLQRGRFHTCHWQSTCVAESEFSFSPFCPLAGARKMRRGRNCNWSSPVSNASWQHRSPPVTPLAIHAISFPNKLIIYCRERLKLGNIIISVSLSIIFNPNQEFPCWNMQWSRGNSLCPLELTLLLHWWDVYPWRNAIEIF